MPIPRHLSPSATVEGLRKQAKRWKRAIDLGDPEASSRFRAAMGAVEPSLRQIQQATAREYGFKSWAELRQELEGRLRSQSERVELFLEKGVNRYGVDPRTGKWGAYEQDGAARGAVAARLLARYPDLAHQNIHIAVLAHDLDVVGELLTRSPALANHRSEFDRWTPLARLTYARLPLPETAGSPLEIARLLLAAGAEAGAPLTGAPSDATALTGAIGGGEGGQTPHPQALELANLLIEHGADPLDGQALYNTSLGEDDVSWLEFLWSASEKRGEAERWRSLVPQLTGPPLDYLLGNATPRHPRRVSWLLEHGADANAVNAYSKQPVLKHAMIEGADQVVSLLAAHGARSLPLSPAEAFRAAVARGDLQEVTAEVRRNPKLLEDSAPLFVAVHRNAPGMAAHLLDLGMSPDVAGHRNLRALHLAADVGAVSVARLLIERGAQIDPIEHAYNSTPLGHAHFHGQAAMIALLAPLSQDIRGLCFSAAIERLKALFRADPSLATAPSRGAPPLFALPDDDAKACEVVEMLLGFGADPAVSDAEGRTPAEAAARRGLEEAAALLASE